MNRRNFVKTTSLTAGLLALSHKEILAMIQQQPYKVKMLRSDIGIFTERGGTILFSINKPGIVVVDAEFPEQSSHLISELKTRSSLPFNLLINTHHHQDHTSGNISFKGLVQHVVAHQNSLNNQKAVAVKQNKEDQQLYPDVTFTDTWKGKIGSQKIKAHYFGAGHTNGDAIIHFEDANIAHMGDLVFNRRFAFVDRSAGANIQSWVSVLDKALNTFNKDTLFVFGHAFDPEKVTGNKEDLKAMQNYLDKLLTYVREGIKVGKSKEELLKVTSIPGAPEWQGDSIDKGITAAYEELTA